MSPLSTPAALLLLVPLVVSGCASVRLFEIPPDHPANPRAPAGPVHPPDTLDRYRSSADFAAAIPGGPHAEAQHGTAHGVGEQDVGGAGHEVGAEAGHAGHSPGAPVASAPGPAGRPGQVSAVTRTVTVEARDIAFDVKRLQVRPGETVRFVVTNVGKLEHEFAIGTPAEMREHRAMMAKMPGMHHEDGRAVTVKPGETKELVWRFDGPANLEFACNVPGHAEAGMTGTIEVTGSRS